MNNFTIKEFDSPDVKGSGQLMDETFLSMLDEARTLANIPFKINSGFRTEKHNKKVGGVKGSSHTRGFAADISCVDSNSRFIILNALISVGFNRMGVYKTFIHCDIDNDKPRNVIWYK
jgi:zinc D-Ala-D-Ala carboxypeptidase